MFFFCPMRAGRFQRPLEFTYMAKNNRRFGPADRAVVITQLLAGATVAAAARAAGFAVQTLYTDRQRCALFARAWADAVRESARPRLVERGTGGWWQIKRLRRNRFTRARKDVFLGTLAVTCEVSAAARAAEVCTSTVYSHRASDPAFAAAWRVALATGVAVLTGRLLEEQLVALEPFDVEPGDLPPPVPREPVARDLDFWRTMHLLREHKAGVGGAGIGVRIGGAGPAGVRERGRRGVRPRIRSRDEVHAEVRKGLAAFERQVRAAGNRVPD